MRPQLNVLITDFDPNKTLQRRARQASKPWNDGEYQTYFFGVRGEI